MEQTPNERADGTRLNHDSFCRASTHKLALALAIMVKKGPLQPGLAEGREGRMGRSFQQSKSAFPLWEMFLHQPVSSRQDWVSFQDHRNCLPCQCDLHSQLETSTVCSPPVTDTEMTHNWKMPDERRKKKPKEKVNSV